jgi:uncharacterized protein YyaL (SSP411 family)
MLLKKIETAARLMGNQHFYYLLSHPSPGVPRDDVEPRSHHAEAAVDWLLRAHQVCNGNGFAKLYSFATGWKGPYVETTGYIIPTLYAFRERNGYRRPAVDLAISRSLEFLLSVQYPDGAFGDSISRDPSVYASDGKMVFDTGQVIFGLLAGFDHEHDERFLEAARRAGDWLCNVQDDDGSWIRHTYSSHPRTYYSRVSSALIDLGRRSGNEMYIDAARRQLRWVVRQQTRSGSFRNCSFLRDELTVLHVIAYTVEGLYASGSILGDTQFLDAAFMGATALLDVHQRDGVLHGHYDPDWKPTDSARCLTGLAQMAAIWLTMFLDTGESRYRDAASVSLTYLRKKQIMDGTHQDIHGAIMGSHPWGGRYFPWAIPNWSEKFFIDALLLEDEACGR